MTVSVCQDAVAFDGFHQKFPFQVRIFDFISVLS